MYSPEIVEFMKTYVRALNESNAAIFAGAGLSKPAGYVNWKELLRDVAEDVGLDIDAEDDLISLAQYHVNKFDGRAKLNQILIDEFTKDITETENHKVLSRLPIKTYWTTNYDKLIETNLENNNKKVDVKIVEENLSYNKSKADAIIYKMHGDSTMPHEAVLTKDDYEAYDLKRQLFSTALRGDLVTETFLFIGFSFDDPNLSYILSRIKILLGENSRNHYCFMKKIKRSDYSNETEFQYAEIKQELKIKDLKRYKIIVLLVSEYQDITDILNRIEKSIVYKNIFISGSAATFGDWEEEEVYKFSANLSKAIVKKNSNIVTGFGLGIGSSVISGALEELYKMKEKNIENRLKSKPFPQNSAGDIPIKELWTKYRKEMLTNVGISIFIFGNKKDENDDIIEADGMLEEFEFSIKNGALPIPIGATGFTAHKLWEKVNENFDRYIGIQSVKPLFEQLNNKDNSKEEIIRLVIDIIEKVERY